MGFTHHDGVSTNNLVVNTKATVPAPSANTDAATKLYVDTAAGTAAAGGSLTNANASAALQTKVALTAAQIKALNATPQTILAAPAAGKAIQVLGVTLSYTKAAADFTNGGGGNATLGINGVAVISAANLTAAIINVGSINKTFIPVDNVTLASATALILSKATAEFAAGDGAIDIIVTYVVVTL